MKFASEALPLYAIAKVGLVPVPIFPPVTTGQMRTLQIPR